MASPARFVYHVRSMKVQAYPFKDVAKRAVANVALRTAINAATTLQDSKRRARAPDLPDLLGLRDLAGRIKQHTLENLDTYLGQFMDAATAAGAKVHCAATGDDARQIVSGILADSGLRHVIKAKSMISEEIELNHALEGLVEVTETDLGEFIVQIDHDTPSHIVTPVIHKTGQGHRRQLPQAAGHGVHRGPRRPSPSSPAPHLRGSSRPADIGISGANFGVAETGTVCVCTNEGNGRMCTSRPKVHIVLMGIEKVIPRLSDLAVFLKLLGRSATGQTMTVYTTLITGPARSGECDGPEELHIVLRRPRPDEDPGRRRTASCCGASAAGRA